VTVTFKYVALLLAAILFPVSAGQINVAAASNLTEVARTLGSQFEARTGISVVFSFGSTAQLTMQIENGAPFDAFLAADSTHIEQLERKHLLVPGSRARYADGVLALWIPSGSVTQLQDLVLPQVRVIAVAKPELAPYGAAAMEALRQAGVLDKVRSKIVYSDSISMAKQYGVTGNADAVFTARSLLLNEQGKVIPVNAKLPQELAIIGASARKTDAAKFTAFVQSPEGRKILTNSGYK
jgi:molybdate transport system substrate-binding protein